MQGPAGNTPKPWCSASERLRPGSHDNLDRAKLGSGGRQAGALGTCTDTLKT